MTKKLDLEYLDIINGISEENIEVNFGCWIKDQNTIQNLKDEFANNNPFSHCIINNFLNVEFADKIEADFPLYQNNDSWYTYHTPLEVKFARDDLSEFPVDIQYLFYLLSSNHFLCIMKQITGIGDLQIDDYLHGAGIH